MKKYTIGVAHNEDNVVLIRKTKPAWQEGKLNFVGGKVEPGETYLQCMVREFSEETGIGIDPSDWRYVGKMSRVNDFTCKIFTTSHPDLNYVRTMTEEEVVIVNPDKFVIDSELQSNMISNLLTIYNFIISPDFQEQGAELILKYPLIF